MKKMLALAIAIVFGLTVFASAESKDEAQSGPEYPLGSLQPDCVVYMKNPDELVFCPPGKTSVTLPEGTVGINTLALSPFNFFILSSYFI